MVKVLAASGSTPNLPPSPAFGLEFDGACAPNPGPMGIGYLISDQHGQVRVQVGAQIGPGTNNAAEYHALINGLRHALRIGAWNLIIQTDSQLVMKQIGFKHPTRPEWSAPYKTKDAHLKKLRDEARALLLLFSSSVMHHRPREENSAADTLSRLMVYDEPDFGPTRRDKQRTLALHGWQAAAIRFWWRHRTRNAYLLGRVMGIQNTQVEAIGNGTAYRWADFSEWPWHKDEPPPALAAPADACGIVCGNYIDPLWKDKLEAGEGICSITTARDLVGQG